ncbi:MAG: response regulator transcription factor [Magnetococcales bacterium]|nr:response regulator transcription factor [Magnetococcales bacterium]NGZ25250.1 response regulator transcription factor [Magnetococcales bacterium]
MNNPLPTLMIVEDDADLRTDLVDFFTMRGYQTRGVEDGDGLFEQWSTQTADLVILDVMLPGESGLEIATKLRQLPKVPGIMMLTCRTETEDQVAGLTAGADVYLTKGTDLLILEASINSLWRRITNSAAPAPPSDHWVLDGMGWTLMAPNGRLCKLTAMEKNLLLRLFQEPGTLVDRSTLVCLLDKEDTPTNRRNLDVLVLRLRKKVLEELYFELPLEVIYGRGLAFNAKVSIL